MIALPNRLTPRTEVIRVVPEGPVISKRKRGVKCISGQELSF